MEWEISIYVGIVWSSFMCDDLLSVSLNNLKKEYVVQNLSSRKLYSQFITSGMKPHLFLLTRPISPSSNFSTSLPHAHSIAPSHSSSISLRSS